MFALLGVIAVSPRVAAMPFVSPMFTDNMVLQRDMNDPVWGWAAPGTAVKVTIEDHSASTTTGDDGKWMVKIRPPKVGGPYTMTVEGPQTVTFKNVLVGDVWICSGQSNMEFGVGNLANPQAEIAAADHPTMRLYVVPHDIAAAPVAVNPGDWRVCTPENLGNYGLWSGFTAVGYFFGRKLNDDLKVPIGLIQTAWGGTVAEAWTREQDLARKLPEFKGQIDQVNAYAADVNHTSEAARLAAFYKANDAGDGKWSDPSFDDSGWKTMTAPGYFQNAGMPEFNNRASVVWFRRTVDVPEDAAGKSATMHLQVDDDDAVWVNGTMIGSTRGVQVKRVYNIPSGVLKAGQNMIAIRVTDTSAPGGIIGTPDEFTLNPDGGSAIPLGGTWHLKLGTVIDGRHAMPMSIGDNPNVATVLYNGMIEPIAPFGVKGAIWYQGESNGDRGYQYRTLMPTMIASWRERFDNKFPFFMVQLAGWQPSQNPNPGDDNWAELREAQFMTTKTSPRTGIATAIDIGDPVDIHPKNKQEVGRRLALAAEAEVYRQRVVYSGPVYRGMSVDGNGIRIRFDHTDGGLKTKDGGGVKGMQIAGADHKWVWADAKVDGNEVVVWSTQVPNPVAVRYAWRSYTDANLYNGSDLPAFPFRTDDWKIPSQK